VLSYLLAVCLLITIFFIVMIFLTNNIWAGVGVGYGVIVCTMMCIQLHRERQ